MKFYKFKTFTTSYYFPKLDSDQHYMYNLYSAYGGRLSKLYWWLFRHSSAVRNMNKIEITDLPFPYLRIKQLAGERCSMSFNMGSPGVEQKISILGYDKDKCTPFFAKYSEKTKAQELTRNEVKVYRQLSDTGLVPKLLGFEDTDDYVFLKAEYIKGNRPESKEVTDKVVHLALNIANYHMAPRDKNLLTCLSHGDFCPWNVLVNGDNWRLIDWELAAERPLGFDLFTWITQVSLLFEPDRNLNDSIQKHHNYITQYFKVFQIEDYQPYLFAFAKEKAVYEKSKGNYNRALKFEELYS